MKGRKNPQKKSDEDTTRSRAYPKRHDMKKMCKQKKKKSKEHTKRIRRNKHRPK